MRNLALPVAAGLLAGCTSTVLAEPRLHVSPYLALYQVRGTVGTQSEPVPGGGLQDNAPQTMRTFGQDHYREDVGVRALFGDGFGGLGVDYLKLEQNAARGDALTADWGRLLVTDVVKMNVEMDELRVGYLEPLLHVRTTWRDQPLAMRLAGGAVLAHRAIELRATTIDGLRRQNVEIDGDVAYAAARFRAKWRDLAFDVDYAISPELVLGGDFDGVLHDVEARLAYSLPLYDVTFFAGYRYSEFEADGDANGFGYAADLSIDGFQLGMTVTL